MSGSYLGYYQGPWYNRVPRRQKGQEPLALPITPPTVTSLWSLAMSTCPCISFTSLKHIVLCLSRRDLGVSHQKLINQFVFAKVTPLLSGTLGEHCHVLSGCPLHPPPPKCQPPAADVWVPNRPWGSLMFRPPPLCPSNAIFVGFLLGCQEGLGFLCFCWARIGQKAHVWGGVYWLTFPRTGSRGGVVKF